MVTIRPVTAGGFIEGSYTSWSSLGQITLTNTPDSASRLACLIDAQDEILYAAYRYHPVGYVYRMAAYQLPGKTLISDWNNNAYLTYNSSGGVGHGTFGGKDNFMFATVSGKYILQSDLSAHLIISSGGAEIEDLTPAEAFDYMYISMDGKYVVVTAHASPYKIEVFAGS